MTSRTYTSPVPPSIMDNFAKWPRSLTKSLLDTLGLPECFRPIGSTEPGCTTCETSRRMATLSARLPLMHALVSQLLDLGIQRDDILEASSDPFADTWPIGLKLKPTNRD